MKHTFKKSVLLASTFAILLSAFPVHAMEEADVEATVSEKVEQHSGWDRESLKKKLDSAMDFFKNQGRGIMRCMKGEGCSKGQIIAFVGLLTTILALVYTLGGRRGWYGKEGKIGAPYRWGAAGLGAAAAGLAGATRSAKEMYQERIAPKLPARPKFRMPRWHKKGKEIVEEEKPAPGSEEPIGGIE